MKALLLDYLASNGGAAGAAAYIMAAQTEAIGQALIVLSGVFIAVLLLILALGWMAR